MTPRSLLVILPDDYQSLVARTGFEPVVFTDNK